jgi:formate C-acetyltransferase
MTTDTALLTPCTPRIERLRAHALAAAHACLGTGPEVELLAARSWWASGSASHHLIRRGKLAGDILRGMTPVIDPDELLVGKFSHRPLTDDEQADVNTWRAYGEPATSKAYGQRSHMAVDYDRLLCDGVDGIAARIARYRAALDITRAEDYEKDAFYAACLEALEGMVALSERYADHAEALAAEADPARAVELREIARICRRVPRHAPDTFREAMQAVHFLTFCLCAGNRMHLFQLGRPDRYLWGLYARDLAAGRITPDAAQELIDCLALLLNEYTPRGLAVGWMVGGRDASGHDVTNELSYLFTQTVGHTRLAYPCVGICWSRQTPPALMALASALLARGYSHPALFNDEVITRGLLDLGLAHRDACLYIHSTCVEITPIAQSNVYVASPYYNLVQCLHDVLGIPPLGGAPGPLPEIPTFDDLLSRYQARLRALLHDGVVEVHTAMASRRQGGGFPLLSCFVNDCLARGCDIDHGGARVNWVEFSAVGLANLVDALAAIRQCVYTDGTLTLATLRDALLANFTGYPEVQAQLARVPKYGTDNDAVDALAVTITEFLRMESARYRTYWGDAVVPGFFCWIMHERLGRETCASADGRCAGFPFADGSGPAQGRERLGPTAAIRSVTKWNHAPMIGGIAVNMRFAPGNTPEALAAPLQGVLESFLRLGGFETQINVVDATTLRDAQAHPERHRDLVVRVAGYSDYFVGLSSEMQAEVIMRAEMGLG